MSLDPKFLGLEETEALSRNQTNKWMRTAEARCGDAVENAIAPELERAVIENLGAKSGAPRKWFGLPQIRPGSMRRPLLNVRQRDHRSISTGALMRSFQSASRSAIAANSGTMGLTEGSSAL